VSTVGWASCGLGVDMASNASRKLSLVRRPTDSAEDFSYQVELAVARFGAAVTPALRARVGQPEASLTSPVERLLTELADALGLHISIFREAAEPSLGIRPDLAVYVDGAPVGVVELKAPNKGVPGAPLGGLSLRRTRGKYRDAGRQP